MAGGSVEVCRPRRMSRPLWQRTGQQTADHLRRHATGYGFQGMCDFAGGTTVSSGLATSGTAGLEIV